MEHESENESLEMYPRLRANITKTISFDDPVEAETLTLNVGKYIEESPDNIVFVYHNNKYFFTKRSIIKKQENQAKVYPCKIVNSMSPESVMKNQPYYDLKKLDFIGGYFCNMKEFNNQDKNQLFSVINTDKTYPNFCKCRYI